VSVKSLASASGKSLSTVRASIRRGQELVHRGVDEHGFTDPDGSHYERDPDSERGFTDPYADR
jgi:hypothetical protein